MACLSIYISCLDSNRVICNEWKHFTQLHQLEVWHCVTLNKSLYRGSDIKASSISNALWQANASYSKCLLATQTLMYPSDRDFHPHCQRDKNSKDPCLSWRETRFSYQTSLGQTSSLKDVRGTFTRGPSAWRSRWLEFYNDCLDWTGYCGK